jgi:hypothetical protein
MRIKSLLCTHHIPIQKQLESGGGKDEGGKESNKKVGKAHLKVVLYWAGLGLGFAGLGPIKIVSPAHKVGLG